MKQKIFIFSLLFFLLMPMLSCKRRNSRPSNRRPTPTEISENRRSANQRGKTIIKMRKEDGVYHIPCKINGTEMEFIFDTGASDITMSLTEALFLYKQGKLKDDDFLGTQQYQVADGSVLEGKVVMLRKVEIGNKKLFNIQASIVDNMEAPLLLGQSVLEEFGEISINYHKNEITFK
ncbi:MAG: retroviral-like aspartic protease family protein [Candidatus Azobacteroides sp.]|nr:retroviral-like aspartic protease family protein [Candidatus Azobacteroides sp.]